MTYPTGHPSPFHFDMALQEPVFAMERRGILIDEEKRKEYLETYNARLDDAQAKLNGLAGYQVNVSSNPQMKALFYDELKFKTRMKYRRVTCNEDAIRSMMAEAEDRMLTAKMRKTRIRWARSNLIATQVLKVRGYRVRIERYINAPYDADKRMRSTISVGATETGRFSASKTLWGTGCNLQTIPHELRGMFSAPEGYVLAEFDLNRGESWVYAHLAEDIEMMDIHTDGQDFHSITAAAVSEAFGQPRSLDEIIAEKGSEDYQTGTGWGYRLRFLGKKTNHASAYQMGPFRFVEVVNEEADDTGITIVQRQAKLAQRIWQEKYFRIPQWWNEIQRELNRTRTLKTPFGRVRIFNAFWGKDLFKEATAYVPQSTSVDFLNCGMLNVYHSLDRKGAFGIRLLHQNHDSILVEFPAEHVADAVPAILHELGRPEVVITGMLTGTCYPISIPVEAEVGENWGALNEWTP